MKKLLILLSLLTFAISIQAQTEQRYGSSRLTNLSQNLVRQTVDLADRTSEDLRRASNARADIEAAFLAAQFDSSAHLFDQMVRDSRSASELRDAASLLTDLSRRAPAYGTNSLLWRNVQTAVADIQRELGGGGGNDGGNSGDTRPVIGRVAWRGKVDIETQLFIRADSLETRVVAGPNWGGESYNFTSPLPSRRVEVGVNLKKGRGSVRVLQQPGKDNDFTAVVQILDPQGGYKDYELDIYWR